MLLLDLGELVALELAVHVAADDAVDVEEDELHPRGSRTWLMYACGREMARENS